MRLFYFSIFCFLFTGCFMAGSNEDGIVVLASKSEPSSSNNRRSYSNRSRSRLGSSSGSRRSKQTYTVGAGGSTTAFLSENPSLNVEDYLDSVVYIYQAWTECDSEITGETAKTNFLTCVKDCIDDDGPLISNISDCINNGCKSGCSLSAASGSGVYMSSSHVLTNHHVVDGAINNNQEVNDEYIYHFATTVENHSEQTEALDTVICHDEDSDLAYFSLAGAMSNADPPEHGDLDDLSLLDELWTIGNPGRVKWTASKGHLTNKDPDLGSICPRVRGKSQCITYDIPTSTGNSGGPIFDSRGQLMALVAGTVLDSSNAERDNLGYGPHIDWIKEFLAKSDCRNSGGGTSQNSFTQGLSRSERRDLARRIKELVLELN